MIVSIAAYELTLLRRDRRAWWALLCLAALVLLSFAANSIELARANAAKSAIAAAERARWLQQGDKDPHSAAHYSIYAFKPAPPLAALDLGVEPYVGQAVWLEAHVQNDLLFRPQGDASLLQRAGLTHPAGLLIGFAPLIAFLLAFSTVAMDRERGTWRLALGASLSPRAMVAGKALTIWSAMTGALVVPCTFVAAIALVAQGVASADTLVRLALWALAMSVYIALFVAAGVAVSIRTANVRTALAVLFGLWIVFALALPRWASTAIDTARPLPSTQSVKQHLQEAAPVYWTAEASREHQAKLLAQHGVQRKEDLKVDLRGAELDMSERHSHEVYDRVLGAFYDRVQAQDRGYAALGLLSPATALQSLSQAIVGSDFVHHRRFIEAAEHYRRALVNRMNAAVMAHPANEAGPRHTEGATLWAQVPAFDYVAPSLAQAWGVAAPAAIALFAWLLGVGGWLHRASRRMTP